MDTAEEPVAAVAAAVQPERAVAEVALPRPELPVQARVMAIVPVTL